MLSWVRWYLLLVIILGLDGPECGLDWADIGWEIAGKCVDLEMVCHGAKGHG